MPPRLVRSLPGRGGVPRREDRWVARHRRSNTPRRFARPRRLWRRMSSVSALDAPGRPEVLAQWAFRYLLEFNAGITKKCPHGDWSRVHTIFGVEPNRAYCPECAPKRREGTLAGRAPPLPRHTWVAGVAGMRLLPPERAGRAGLFRGRRGGRAHDNLRPLPSGALNFSDRIRKGEPCVPEARGAFCYGPLGRPPRPPRAAFRAAVRRPDALRHPVPNRRGHLRLAHRPFRSATSYAKGARPAKARLVGGQLHRHVCVVRIPEPPPAAPQPSPPWKWDDGPDGGPDGDGPAA
jgi:hypothetical protein